MSKLKLRKPTWQEVYRFLGSRGFSYIAISSVAILMAMWIIPFQIYGVPGWRVQNMANKVWFFRLSYGLTYLSLFFCMLQLYVRVRARRGLNERIRQRPEQLTEMPNYTTTKLADAEDFTAKLALTLRRNGYRVLPKERPDNFLYGVKGQSSRWGTLLFHLSLFAIIIGVFISINNSFYGETIVTEGQTFSAQEDPYTVPAEEELQKLRGRLPDLSFQLQRVSPVFWEDKLLFTNLEAEVVYPEGTTESYATVKLNSPMFHRGTFLELAGFGYSPYFILKNQQGNTLYESYVNLGIFPSGNEDYFQVPGLPYEIHVLVWSDYYSADGNPGTKSYNLSNPLYTVYILKDKDPMPKPDEPQSPENKELVIKGNYKPGEAINFAGYTLTFPDIRYYGQFRIIYDPGLILVFGGFGLMALGLCWRFFLYRRQVWAVVEQSSSGPTLHLAGISDYYRDSFADELKKIRSKSGGKGDMA
ncbi:MAG TPA: cytochrome c biogenesis protein ResB [Verrucomicrobiae bacterium]|nr:cytochrome c biogenesis protein ResB [Verrucomicrobiae bacterium]